MKSQTGDAKKTEATPTIQPQVHTLCGVQGCCPTVTFDKGQAVITDDHGGKVVLTLEEFAELQNLQPA